MKVRRGRNTRTGAPVRWIETRTTWEFDLIDMINALCSFHIRNRTEDTYADDPLPDSLSVRDIVRTVREETEHHGVNVWTWTESHHGMTDADARAWARGLILAVLPDLEI